MQLPHNWYKMHQSLPANRENADVLIWGKVFMLYIVDR